MNKDRNIVQYMFLREGNNLTCNIKTFKSDKNTHAGYATDHDYTIERLRSGEIEARGCMACVKKFKNFDDLVVDLCKSQLAKKYKRPDDYTLGKLKHVSLEKDLKKMWNGDLESVTGELTFVENEKVMMFEG